MITTSFRWDTYCVKHSFKVLFVNTPISNVLMPQIRSKIKRKKMVFRSVFVIYFNAGNKIERCFSQNLNNVCFGLDLL